MTSRSGPVYHMTRGALVGAARYFSDRLPGRGGFQLRQAICKRADLLLLIFDLLLLGGDGGVLLLQLVEQHGVQHPILYRLDLPIR